ncbi:MAG TPA: HAD family hydrolase [Solirubrobacterales bacterium]
MSDSWADIEAVSFDVGGTLVPELGGPATVEIGSLLGLDLPAARALLDRSAKRRRGSPAELAAELAAHAADLSRAAALEALLLRRRDLAARAKPYEDTAPTLETLRRRGFPIVFLSNVIGAIAPDPGHPLLGLADLTISSCDTGYVKPEREAFAAAERALGVPANRIVHVGNARDADVEGALAAGWRAMLLDRRGSDGTPPTSDPDRFRRIRSLSELPALLPSGD